MLSRRVSWYEPVFTKLITLDAEPVIWPAKSEATVSMTVSVEAFTAELLVTIPPVPGKMPTLEKLPNAWLLPFRSSVAPPFKISELALTVVGVAPCAAGVLAL